MERWAGAGWGSLWGAGWGRWPAWELLAACAVIGAVGWLLRLLDRRPRGRRAPLGPTAPPAEGSRRRGGSRPGEGRGAGAGGGPGEPGGPARQAPAARRRPRWARGPAPPRRGAALLPRRGARGPQAVTGGGGGGGSAAGSRGPELQPPRAVCGARQGEARGEFLARGKNACSCCLCAEGLDKQRGEKSALAVFIY